jgi:hypothetical protein
MVLATVPTRATTDKCQDQIPQAPAGQKLFTAEIAEDAENDNSRILCGLSGLSAVKGFFGRNCQGSGRDPPGYRLSGPPCKIRRTMSSPICAAWNLNIVREPKSVNVRVDVDLPSTATAMAAVPTGF